MRNNIVEAPILCDKEFNLHSSSRHAQSRVRSRHQDNSIADQSNECIAGGGSDAISKLEYGKFRKGARSRRVPNLLAGTPLLPGPITPSFMPSNPPYFRTCSEGNHHSEVAIFPNFMLTPEVNSDSGSDYMRETMQTTLGFPVLVADPSYINGLSSQETMARNARKSSTLGTPRERPKIDNPQFRKKSYIKRFEAKVDDFPQLGDKDVDITTPSPQRMKQARFPSKNQLKKKCF